jgi:hypothetical protein
MKKLTLIFTLLFSTVMFSSTSFAEWTKLVERTDGDIFYVDYERIRKVDGYIYWWDLSDLLKPEKSGDVSFKSYNQGDCKLFRYKTLTYSWHKEPMGGGTNKLITPKNPEWNYPAPNSSMETILKKICKGEREWVYYDRNGQISQWTKVLEIKTGTYYVDFSRIREHNGYVYFWQIFDQLEQDAVFRSGRVYHQGDCKLFRFKILVVSFHKEPMGKGKGKGNGQASKTIKKDWRYPPPNSDNDHILKSVCSR